MDISVCPASESNAIDWDKGHMTGQLLRHLYWLADLADEEKLVCELANESGDVGHDGFLQEGETPHDGCGGDKQKRSRSE